MMVAVGVLAGAAMAQGPPGDAGPPESITVGPPEGVAKFVGTSPLAGPGKVDPVSLSGKIRVESQHLGNTTVELVENSSSNFTLDITVTGNATNVTFFLNKQAVETSQDIENVTMEIDGKPAEFGVNESGGKNWIVFEIEDFSTRTVTFTSDGVKGGSNDSSPDQDDGTSGSGGVPDGVNDVDKDNVGAVNTSELQSGIEKFLNNDGVETGELQDIIDNFLSNFGAS